VKQKEPFKMIQCAICGKQFVVPFKNLYKVEFAGKVHNCCSYTCYRKAQRAKQENKQSEYIQIQKENAQNEDKQDK